VVIVRDEAASIEPDLVVIDTSDIAELRARHPWLFAEKPAESSSLSATRADADGAERFRRIDADLTATEEALNDADETDNADTAGEDGLIARSSADHAADDDARDAGWSR
jgi:hypothetical protein